MKKLIALTVVSATCAAFAAEPAAEAVVTVDMGAEIGPIKPMHAVNNGPTVKKPGGDQKRGNFEDYRAARIPFARTHDSINCVAGGAHTCDISAVFPDFDADENDPKNYDFVFTDHYLDNMRRAGTEVFFRLGYTIEHGPKKYGVLPPKDFAKWARICEHVIRHYNEGWAWGLDTAPTTRNIAWSNQFNIVYWEVGNEPDLDWEGDQWKTNPRMWGGTAESFFELFGGTVKHLKGKFPHLKIGGPALCFNQKWADLFLGYCEKNKVPLDFFSWHQYARTPESFARNVRFYRSLLDRHGYEKTESILDEWGYVKGWTDDFVYSATVMRGSNIEKGTAFIVSVMMTCQDGPLDMLMFYDARPSSLFCSLFDAVTLWPLKGYYPFYAWSRLCDYGTQVACSVADRKGVDSEAKTGFVEKKDKAAPGGFRAVSAKGADGSLAVMLARFTDDDNVSDTGTVTVRVPGKDLSKARCHMTDMVRTYTEVSVMPQSDGSVAVRMQPYSFALVEFE